MRLMNVNPSVVNQQGYYKKVDYLLKMAKVVFEIIHKAYNVFPFTLLECLHKLMTVWL